MYQTPNNEGKIGTMPQSWNEECDNYWDVNAEDTNPAERKAEGIEDVLT